MGERPRLAPVEGLKRPIALPPPPPIVGTAQALSLGFGVQGTHILELLGAISAPVVGYSGLLRSDPKELRWKPALLTNQANSHHGINLQVAPWVLRAQASAGCHRHTFPHTRTTMVQKHMGTTQQPARQPLRQVSSCSPPWRLASGTSSGRPSPERSSCPRAGRHWTRP